MKHPAPTSSPLKVWDAGKQPVTAKLFCVTWVLVPALVFGFIGFGGFWIGVSHPSQVCLATAMCLGALLCLSVALRILRFGHLNRVELYEDQILVYDISARSYQLHFSEVQAFRWDTHDRVVFASLPRAFFNAARIRVEHFGSEDAAHAFIAIASEKLRAYRRSHLPSTM